MKTKLLILILALQTALLLGITLKNELNLAHGRVVLLETRPVDPRDFLRGDYVTLSYDISRLPTSLFQPAPGVALAPGSAVYVLLSKEGKFHRAITASVAKPEPGDGQVVLKGTVESSWAGSIQVRYGLERYYVREGTGNPAGKVTVEVAVNNSGHGTIKEVFIDDKPYGEVMKMKGR
jgi:uncharacterized membrane-anchored protein